MATKLIRTDDIDGTPDASSYTFALNGKQYELDLSEANYGKLEAALAPFLKVASQVTARLPRERGVSSAPRSASNKEELTAIRLWAKDNGYEVSERGRIAQSVQDAFHAAKG